MIPIYTIIYKHLNIVLGRKANLAKLVSEVSKNDLAFGAKLFSDALSTCRL